MRRLLAIGILLFLPLGAYANQEWLFSLKKGENVVWKGFGQIIGQARDDGILLTTTGTGGFVTSDFEFDALPDSLHIVSSAKVDQNMLFVWILKDGTSMAREIALPAGSNQTTDFNLATEEAWKDGVQTFGLQLEPQSELLLTSVAFSKATGIDALKNAFLSFWDFDTYRTYAINFVWGPQLTFNDTASKQLWYSLPPQSLSATKVMNITMIMIIILMTIVLAFQTSLPFEKKKKSLFRWSLIVFCCAWVFLDVRMGSEYLSWMFHDASTYITQSPDERTFRDRERFYDFAEWAKQYVKDREHYVFFAETPWPYLGNMRYITYPSIPGNNLNDDTWVIYKRPEMMVDSEGRLSADGSPLTRPGAVLDKFGKGSFVFRVNP